ncbi:hypothetical protein, partial [Acidisoma sp. 7E03]
LKSSKTSSKCAVKTPAYSSSHLRLRPTPNGYKASDVGALSLGKHGLSPQSSRNQTTAFD